MRHHRQEDPRRARAATTALFAAFVGLLLLSAIGCGDSTDSSPDNLGTSNGFHTCATSGDELQCYVDCSPASPGCCPIGSSYSCLPPSTMSCDFTPCSSDCSKACELTTTKALTTVAVKNDTNASLTVGLVGFQVFGACTDPLPIESYPCDSITTSGVGGKCTFTLAKGASKSFPPVEGKNTCVTILFGGLYSACDQPGTEGFTQGEVTANVQAPNLEVVDISLVNGWNGALSIDLTDSPAWYFGGATHGNTLPPTSITTVGPNGDLGASANATAPGVFPNGCDVCNGRSKNPCPDHLQYGGECKSSNPTDNAPDCEANRSSPLGGTVTFVWHGAPS
jgi:hypothetical protein